MILQCILALECLATHLAQKYTQGNLKYKVKHKVPSKENTNITQFIPYHYLRLKQKQMLSNSFFHIE